MHTEKPKTRVLRLSLKNQQTHFKTPLARASMPRNQKF